MPKSSRQSDTAFAIVLFTDMVGSTAIASELGDRRWRVLQAKHHSVIRTQLRKNGGREVDTAGDGFFATFAEGEAAIRCACAIRDAVMDIGLQVRCGLNIGQVETNDGKPTGAAVVAAARIMSKAGDGEVLVSNLLRELIPGSTIEFADAGLYDLKGLDGPWHLFRVVADGGPPLAAAPPAEELATRRASTVDKVGADGSSLSRTRKILAGVAAFLVLAAGISFLRTRDDAGASTIAPNSIGILDADSGEVSETIGLEGRPGSVAASTDSVWVTLPDIGKVTQIDSNDQQVRDTIQVGENPTAIAVGDDAVWVVNSGGPSISRISLASHEVVKTIEVGNGPLGIAVGEGSVWVTNRFDGTISRIDPDTNAVVEIPVGFDPRGIAVGFGAVWVGLTGSNTVVRVDPQTNEVTRAIGVGNAPGSLAVSEDSVWVVNSLDDTVMRINPDTSSIVGTTEVEDGPSGIAIVQEIVWVANEADGTLSRIEPGQTSASRTDIGSVPEGLADVNGDLWVSVHGAAASHRGGTLRIVSLQKKEVATLDSRVAYTVGSSRILHLIGDGLVAFKPSDTTPVPDLATSLPTPTDGGRIYTFELRPGILYSSGETVEPGDFRRGLEQGFRLNVGLYKYFYGGLVGGAACGKEPETCDLRDGVVTDDASGMIAFHLTAPDPEFLFKLTLPFAYPVPPSVPDEEQSAAGVPGTGPYKLESPMTGDGLTLTRNPRFRVWSPSAQPDGYVDRMEWSFGVEPQAQIDAVTTGEADLMFEAVASGRLDEILVRNAAQVHTSPLARTVFDVLDISVPPFDNLQVRQAVNFAVDRERVVQAFGGAALPTCQQIPPNFPGYEPYCPYTIDPGPEGEGSWTGPDMRRAHRLIHRSGTTGMRVTFQYAGKAYGAGWQPPGDYMVELLRELGYRVSVWSPSGDPGNQPQMYLGGWSADYPAASNFIANIFSCDATVFSEGFCDPQIDRMIDHALDVQADDPVAAGALWAEVDRKIVDQAPFLWLVTAIDVDFVSERVGNYQSSLQYGVLLNQLWVR